MHVSRRVDSCGEDGLPKSAAGVRTIPLSAMITRLLKERRLLSKFWHDEDLVSLNKKVRHTCHGNLSKQRYKPALKMAGVSGINWHSLRHYAVSIWIEVGLTPKTVQTFAGHCSLAVTMYRYGHLFPS